MVDAGIYTAVIEYNGGLDDEDNCSLSVTPWSEWNKLMFQITRHSNDGDSCLSFAQGENGDTEIPGLYGEYCGPFQPPLNHQFVVEKLHIIYKPHTEHFYFSQVFEIVVTVFKDKGECLDYQCDNKRCIPHDLRCTDYNPCGDSSDCPSDSPNHIAVGKIFGIIVGVAVGIVILMIFIRCWMSAAGKESDDWDSEPRLPSMDGERTPSLHDSGLQSQTRFYNDSLDDSDWQSETRDVSRRHDSDESLDIQPFYTGEGRPRGPFYESRDLGTNQQENTNRDHQTDTTAASNVSPSDPILNNVHSEPFLVNGVQNRTEVEIEMNTNVVPESNHSSAETSDNVTRQRDYERDYERPPPSYESVMADKKYFAVNS
ncbi:uncharacterized protein LOC123550324 isoform X2 [Mercenaria mercenaria]|uniref:uncharacterized protein LOC123550324 isoform X2 n=1 Tax=Mercenaria mercenaria TaxID=6596 RepID=UPI00234ED541|nr:uncharacterized protein LOC123550324 isoform X2 [Mercenaria mercenaria]